MGKMVTLIAVKLRTDRQWLWHCAIKFARWQHPALGRGVLCLSSLVPF